eukprot:scaffold85589_cov15-Prasinocladus_malaysianus.AAC.1
MKERDAYMSSLLRTQFQIYRLCIPHSLKGSNTEKRANIWGVTKLSPVRLKSANLTNVQCPCLTPNAVLEGFRVELAG